MTTRGHPPSDKREISSIFPKLVGFGSVAVLLGGFGFWASTAVIDGAVLASGQLLVDHNRQAVQHPVGGVVEEILVSEGDIVKRGAVLVRLDPTLTLSELAIVEGQLFELMARRGRLEAERDERSTITFDPFLLERAAESPDVLALIEGQRRLFEARADSLEKSLNQLENQRGSLEIQIEGIDAQMDASMRQLSLVVEEVETQEFLLDKGLAQNARLLNLQREEARLEGMRGGLTADRAQATQQISELKVQELRLLSQRHEDAITVLRDLHFNELEVAERRRSLNIQLERMNVKSPVSGVIYDVKLLGERSVIRPADTVMFIVPQDQPLIVVGEIDPVDVDKIYSDQSVIMRFSTFDMRSTPDLFGQVSLISPDAFIDPSSGRSFYRAEITLPKSEVEKLSEDQQLIPGMPVELFMRTGEYSPIEYLMSPLSMFFQKALRDS